MNTIQTMAQGRDGLCPDAERQQGKVKKLEPRTREREHKSLFRRTSVVPSCVLREHRHVVMTLTEQLCCVSGVANQLHEEFE